MLFHFSQKYEEEWCIYYTKHAKYAVFLKFFQKKQNIIKKKDGFSEE